jgi:serine/threonine protein phosphatase PrpC
MATPAIVSMQTLYVESDMDSPELLTLAGGNAVALCRRCPDKQEPNDDSAGVVQTEAGDVVLIVADGVGGCPLGHKASAIAVQSIAQRVNSAAQVHDLRPAILDGIEQANREVLDLGIGAATTLSVVEIRDRTARAYQVGDSMTLIIGQRGALKWKSTPHSPVGYAIESGLLNETEAMHHDDRHIVSNLVGSRSMHIEIGPTRQLQPRDTVIVGSDGLYDNLHLDEVIQHGRAGKLLKRMDALAQLATQRMRQAEADQPGKPDDLTVLMYTPATA